MGGFGEAKQAELQAEHEETKGDPFADLRTELADVDANKPKTHIFMALVGKENTGKSAIVFDFYQRYCDGFDGRQTTLDEFTEGEMDE
tara:strand:- start:3510 stop:3773 length:264 start_codon:yes stop_codon:yes gene_type:complete